MECRHPSEFAFQLVTPKISRNILEQFIKIQQRVSLAALLLTFRKNGVGTPDWSAALIFAVNDQAEKP